MNDENKKLEEVSEAVEAGATEVAPEESTTEKNYISIDDFKKVEIRIGHIQTAEKFVGTDKLLKLSVDFGEGRNRQILSGIALYFPEPSTLVGVKCAFCTNLEPRTIRGEVSEGMIMAGSTEDGIFTLLRADSATPAGTKIK